MNQQYLFYVKYYDALVNKQKSGDQNIESLNNLIIDAVYREDENKIIPFSINGEENLPGRIVQCFTLNVCYPGLLAGLGYPHEAGTYSPDKSREIKLGFSLDYVSGLPYIPGSTLKGVLRSAFRNYDSDIGHLLNVGTDVIKLLENAIFEEGQDVFLDVFPVSGDKANKLLQLEYITSHKATDPIYDGLTNINPLRLLKIRPDVTMLARFLLQDTIVIAGEECFELTSEVKRDLFAIILERYGFGAKTNTGYGHVVRGETTEHDSGFYWLVQDK